MKNSHRYNLILFSAVVSAALFVAITFAVSIGAAVPLDDFWEKILAGGIYRAGAIHFLILVTNIASPLFLTLLSVGTYAILLWRKRGFYDLVFLSALAIGGGLTTFTKYWLNVARPDFSLVFSLSSLTPLTPSFPSGHTAMATVFFLIIAYAFRHEVQSKISGRIFEAVCFALILLIAASRFLLGVHRPSEIIAGFLLGVFAVSFSLLLFKKSNL